MTPAIQRFEMLEQLGAGGMGVVYRARDPRLEREVAIKVLPRAVDRARSGLSTHRTLDLRQGAANVNDLLAEARIMARLSHPNVLPVYEVGLDGGALFIVMELVDGTDLRAYLATPRSVPDILSVFAQTARGLAAAHDHGIVHRDLKPDNVLVGRDGRVRVADFGLSQLVDRDAQLVRVADAAGTPLYMAPELWQFASATPAADVFAFCTALAEALGVEPTAEPAELAAALRARGVPARLCAAVAAGRAPDPDARPSIREVLAVLEHRRRRGAPLVIATAATAVAAAIAAFAITRSHGAPSPPVCVTSPRLLAGRWNPAIRAQLGSQLAVTVPPAPDGSRPPVEPLLALVDSHAQKLVDALRTTCEARSRGELTARDAERRTSCIERRAIELGANVGFLVAAARIDPNYESKLRGSAVEVCNTLELPVLGDRKLVEANYRRYARVLSLAPADRIEELRGIASDAAVAGDPELETRAREWLSRELRTSDRAAEALAELDIAYRRANEIKSVDEEAIILAGQSDAQFEAGNTRAAESIARLARELADRPDTSTGAKLRVYRSLGRAESNRGEYAAAVATLRTGFEVLRKHGVSLPNLEIPMRLDLTDALLRVPGDEQEGLANARETVERARVLLGPRHPNTGIALESLAEAYVFNGTYDQALPYRREALDILRDRFPPEHTQILAQRFHIAETLLDVGRPEEARRELEDIVAIAQRHPDRARDAYATFLVVLGEAAYRAGRPAEGIAWYERGIDATLSAQGAETAETLRTRSLFAGLLIDDGKRVDADKQITVLVQAYEHGKAEPDLRGLARVRGELVTQLLRANHQLRSAENLARDAAAQLAKLSATPAERYQTLRNLGAVLVDRGKFADAGPELMAALDAARHSHSRQDEVALVELQLARAELGIGKVAAAGERAERVRGVLERFGGHRMAMRELRALHAALARASRTAARDSPLPGRPGQHRR